MTKKDKKSLLYVGLGALALMLLTTHLKKKRNMSPEGSISSLPEAPPFITPPLKPWQPEWMNYINYPLN